MIARSPRLCSLSGRSRLLPTCWMLTSGQVIASDGSTPYQCLTSGLGPHRGRADCCSSSCGSAIVGKEFVLTASLETALVTGAGSGIGRGIAAALCNRAVRCLVGRHREKLERARASSQKGRTRPLSPPATSPTGRRQGRRRPGFAGLRDDRRPGLQRGARPEPQLESLDPADWDRMIATNLTGSFNLVHHVLPLDAASRTDW